MIVFRKIIALVLCSVPAIFASAQSLDLFDTKLYAETTSLCDLLNKYVSRNQKFEFTPYGPSFYSVSSYDNRSAIFGQWTYVLRNDSLDQLEFASLDLPINAGWFNQLSKFADSAIHLFTGKYGKPARDTIVKRNYFRAGKKFMPGDIKKAMWLIDGQKLLVDFSIAGEHGNFTYLFRILRYKDYYGNQKLPPWWDGY